MDDFPVESGLSEVQQSEAQRHANKQFVHADRPELHWQQGRVHAGKCCDPYMHPKSDVGEGQPWGVLELFPDDKRTGAWHITTNQLK